MDTKLVLIIKLNQPLTTGAFLTFTYNICNSTLNILFIFLVLSSYTHISLG
jgi:hypothetical protein